MRTRTKQRRIRFPAPHDDELPMPVEIVAEEEEEEPCSEHIVMSQAREIPALQAYLHEDGRRTVH